MGEDRQMTTDVTILHEVAHVICIDHFYSESPPTKTAMNSYHLLDTSTNSTQDFYFTLLAGEKADARAALLP